MDRSYLFLDRTKFVASFAADVEADTASFMADSHLIRAEGKGILLIQLPTLRRETKLLSKKTLDKISRQA